MEKEVVSIDYKEKYKNPLPKNKVHGVDYEVMYEKISKKAQFDKSENIAYAKMKNREQYYEKIDINYVFEKLQGIRRSKDKWKIANGNVIFTEDQRWQFVSGVHSDQKGRFGPKIVEMELGLNPFQVIDWFTDNFGFVYDESFKIGEEFLSSDYVGKGKNKNVFSPPFRNDENWNDVFRYLNEERNIPSTILNELFEQGKLYADTNSRCIFLSNASAEIRGTPASSDPSFKGCSMGGQADVSGFSIMPQLNANESVIAVTEAAIDAISYNVLYPGRYVFSSNGSGRFELHYKVAIEGLTNGFRVSMATDADMAGDVAAQKVFSAFLARNHIYETYSKSNPDLTYKEIDKGIISGDIIIRVDQSPHHLFFNEIGQGKELKDIYQVFKILPDKENGDPVWQDTGETSQKEFSYKILPSAFDFIEESVEANIKVETNQVHSMLKKYHLIRDRAINAKDWNEELKILGTEYSNNFNRCFDNNFKELPILPDYLSKNRKEINPILINDKGEAYISREKVEKKEISSEKNTVSDNEKESPTIFNAKISRQQLFNTIFARYYFNQKFNMPLEEVDNKLRNGDIKFYIDKGQNFLNFIDNTFTNKIEYISKNKEEGEPVFYPPTIRVYGNYLGETKNLIVAEKAFIEIIKRIDHMANIISSSKNQLETLKEMKINCFEYKEDGLPLTVLMGRGKLLEKHEKLNKEKNEENNIKKENSKKWGSVKP